MSEPLDNNLLPISSNPILDKTLKRELSRLSTDLSYIPVESPVEGPVFDRPVIDQKEYPIYDEDIEELIGGSTAKVNLTPDDINELVAQDQSIVGNIGRGLGRAIVKIPEELLNATASVGGLMGWLGTGLGSKERGLVFHNSSHEGIEDFFNSTRDIFGLNAAVPKKVKDGDIWDNLGSSAFWANEGGDAVGFLASFMIGGGAIKSLGFGSKLASPALKGLGAVESLTGVGKAMEGIGTGLKLIDKPIKTAGKFLNSLNSATRSSAKFAEYMGKADEVGAAMFNTFSESATEAGGVYKNVYDQVYTQALASGYNEEEAINMAKTKASDRAAGTFNSNVAILAIPNMIMTQNLLGSFEHSKDIMRGLLKGEKVAGKVWSDLGKKAAKSIFSEGPFEEGTQFAVEKYYSDLSNNPEEKNMFGNLAGIVNQYAKSLPRVATCS